MSSIDEKIKYWIEVSEYDLTTAEAMLETKRYLYVGFMCHQVIEKMFKAYYVSVKNEQPPYIHSLDRLAQLSGLFNELSESQKDFIRELQPLNIEARYPVYKEKLLESLTEKKCKEIIRVTKELMKWIKQKLSH